MYDLCRLRLWDSCRCILSTALRRYNRKTSHCSLRKHRGAGLGTLPLLAASTGPAQAAVQPPRQPGAAGSSGDSPHQALAHAGDPSLTPTPHTRAGILGCRCPPLPAASRTGKGMNRAIPSLHKHLRGHQLSPSKFSISPRAWQADPPHSPHPFPPRGSVCLATVLPCTSLSPVLNLVLALAIKSLLTDIQMVCVSIKSQGAREMSPERGVSPLLRVPPSPPPAPAMLYLLGPLSRPRSLVHTKSRPCAGKALM